MTTTTQHTAASLAAIHSRNPRELDAIAHQIVMQKLYVLWLGMPLDCDVDGISGDPIPRYSTSLDAAALLEKALSERGLRDENYKCLYSVVAGCIDNIAAKHGDVIEAAMFASARDRTIAAVLAAQEAKPIPPAPISVTEVYDDETGQLLAQHVDSIYGSPIDNNINLWMAMGRKLRFTRKMMEAK